MPVTDISQGVMSNSYSSVMQEKLILAVILHIRAHPHRLTMPEVPLTLINEDLTLGKDLRQLLLELPVLLGIGQRLHRSGAEGTCRGQQGDRKMGGEEDGSKKAGQRAINEIGGRRSRRKSTER